MVTKRIFLKNADEVMHLLGQHDENLRRLEQEYAVQIFMRQAAHAGDFSLIIRGAGTKVDKVLAELEILRDKKQSRIYENSSTNQMPFQIYPSDSNTIYTTFQGKAIKPRSEHQKKYIEFVNKYDLVIAIGPAGTGKTFLSVACALDALQKGKVSRIVLTRPIVEAGERLGFLPGDLYEKINPYLKPLYDAFYFMIGPEKFRFLREEETIEIIPLAYMRGRTIEDAFIILDEAQNTTNEQMKMFLTRLGVGSRMIVTGDVTQIDLDIKKQSGLVIAEKIFSDIEAIKIIHFTNEDVVRHELVKNIINAYEKFKAKKHN